jgi:hypothetical protein
MAYIEGRMTLFPADRLFFSNIINMIPGIKIDFHPYFFLTLHTPKKAQVTVFYLDVSMSKVLLPSRPAM